MLPVTRQRRLCAGAWAHGHDADAPAPVFVPLEQAQSLESVLDRMARYRVVIVGETHDRYDHHLNQLGVIRGLHERGVDLEADARRIEVVNEILEALAVKG